MSEMYMLKIMSETMSLCGTPVYEWRCIDVVLFQCCVSFAPFTVVCNELSIGAITAMYVGVYGFVNPLTSPLSGRRIASYGTYRCICFDL